MADPAETPIFPQQPLSLQVRKYIQRAIWPDSEALDDLSEYKNYFEHFEQTIRTLGFGDPSMGTQKFAMRTYGDLKKVVEHLRLDPSKPRKITAAHLEATFPGSSDSQRQRSIELTARLCLMIHMESPIGPILPYTPVDWLDDMSLREAFEFWFPKCRPSSHYDKPRLASALTLVKLRKLHGVHVWWTSNLKDHLEYYEETNTLRIFSHKICLLSHLELEEQEIQQQGPTRQNSGQQETNSMFPDGLLDETIRTLDLLFPIANLRAKKYLEDEGQVFYGASLPRHSQFEPVALNDFHYWRDRLAVLYDVLDRPSSSFRGMLYDRRNPMQWLTFWLAVFFLVLILIFGVAGLTLGFKQLGLLQKAHALAVAQACALPVKPPGWC
ncbi:hypothetical protein JMJ35_009953 [Cladonia borealis]|uniref:Uncharacterized protein n=1 Tax=Cladonia borealis TaxID=184061 RepID=A0AA39QQT2_9LECA|nr:hypothetical protein JMJ35_009953 [Cladonia borealis]